MTNQFIKLPTHLKGLFRFSSYVFIGFLLWENHLLTNKVILITCATAIRTWPALSIATTSLKKALTWAVVVVTIIVKACKVRPDPCAILRIASNPIIISIGKIIKKSIFLIRVNRCKSSPISKANGIRVGPRLSRFPIELVATSLELRPFTGTWQGWCCCCCCSCCGCGSWYSCICLTNWSHWMVGHIRWNATAMRKTKSVYTSASVVLSAYLWSSQNTWLFFRTMTTQSSLFLLLLFGLWLLQISSPRSRPLWIQDHSPSFPDVKLLNSFLNKMLSYQDLWGQCTSSPHQWSLPPEGPAQRENQVAFKNKIFRQITVVIYLQLRGWFCQEASLLLTGHLCLHPGEIHFSIQELVTSQTTSIKPVSCNILAFDWNIKLSLLSTWTFLFLSRHSTKEKEKGQKHHSAARSRALLNCQSNCMRLYLQVSVKQLSYLFKLLKKISW